MAQKEILENMEGSCIWVFQVGTSGAQDLRLSPAYVHEQDSASRNSTMYGRALLHAPVHLHIQITFFAFHSSEMCVCGPWAIHLTQLSHLLIFTLFLELTSTCFFFFFQTTSKP